MRAHVLHQSEPSTEGGERGRHSAEVEIELGDGRSLILFAILTDEHPVPWIDLELCRTERAKDEPNPERSVLEIAAHVGFLGAGGRDVGHAVQRMLADPEFAWVGAGFAGPGVIGDPGARDRDDRP